MKLNKILLISCFLLFACSSTSDKGTNSISPYDTNFDPDPKDEKEKLSDLPEAQLLNDARSAYDRQLYSISKENWIKLKDTYPGSFYATLAELKIADCLYYSGDFSGAVSAYEDFLKLHPAHEATAYVIFQIANSYKEQYTGVENDQQPLINANNNYKKIIELHKDTEYFQLAKQSKAQCDEKIAAHEAFIASFYQKQGKDGAYKGRLQKLVKDYPNTKSANWARNRLGMKLLPEKDNKSPDIANELTSDEVKKVVDQVINDRPNNKSTESIAKIEKIKPLKLELQKKNTLPQKSILNSETYSLTCEKQNGNFVFTMLLPAPVSFTELNTDQNSQQIIIYEKTYPIDLNKFEYSTTNTRGQKCELDNMRFQVAEIFSNTINKGLLKIDYNKNQNFVAYKFTLDRPNRFIVIFHPTN